MHFVSDSGILAFLPYITTKQKEKSFVCFGVPNPGTDMIPDWYFMCLIAKDVKDSNIYGLLLWARRKP